MRRNASAPITVLGSATGPVAFTVPYVTVSSCVSRKQAGSNALHAPVCTKMLTVFDPDGRSASGKSGDRNLSLGT